MNTNAHINKSREKVDEYIFLWETINTENTRPCLYHKGRNPAHFFFCPSHPQHLRKCLEFGRSFINNFWRNENRYATWKIKWKD